MFIFLRQICDIFRELHVFGLIGYASNICFAQVSTGRLLRVWSAHYKPVTCLVFSEDESLLISGADDGFVNVWPLLR